MGIQSNQGERHQTMILFLLTFFENSMKKYLIILFFLIKVSQTVICQYQNHSGLRNRNLKLINIDNNQLFETIQAGLPSDEKLPNWPPKTIKTSSKSKIDSIVVLDDAPLKLIILVYFSGLNTATIQAQAFSQKVSKGQKVISQKMAVQDGQSPLELGLAVALPENSQLISQTLEVNLTGTTTNEINKKYTYTLNKKWNSPLKTENILQTISLEPIASANTLWQQHESDILPNPNKKNSAKSEISTFPKPIIYQNKISQGPSNQSFSLWDNIFTDVDFLLNDLSAIKADIFPDKNPASETFYIVPVSYHLKWSNINKFKDFQILYGKNNEVQYHINLEPGINNKQLETTKYLIKQLYKAQNINILEPKLQLLGANNLSGLNLKTNFQGVFQIDNNKINITAPTEIISPVSIAFSTDNKTSDIINLALQNGIGLNGSLTLNADSVRVQIPTSVAFNDKRNFGKIIFEKANWRNAEWQNTFPFPIKIKYFHAMLESKNKINIYSWACNNKIIQPDSRIKFISEKVPEWLDHSEKTIQIWLDYEVENCPNCTANILKSVTSNLSANSQMSIKAVSIDLFSALNPKIVQLRIKSNQGDITQNKEVEYTQNITKDDTEFVFGPFFNTGDNKINYQYKIEIIGQNETIQTNWYSETNQQLYLSKAAIEKLIGHNLK
jgi:hypothetical protein